MGFMCKIHLNICCLLQKRNLHNKDLYGMNLKSKHWKLVTRVIISFFLKCAFFWQIPAVSSTEYFDPFFISHFWFFIILNSFSASIKMKIQKNKSKNKLIILLRLLHCPGWLNTGNFFPGVKKTKSDYAKSKLATWKNSHTILCFGWIFQQVIDIYSLEKVCNNWIFVKHVAQIKSFWSNRMAFS